MFSYQTDRFRDQGSDSGSSFENGYFHKRPDMLFWQSGNVARSIGDDRARYLDETSSYKSGGRGGGRYLDDRGSVYSDRRSMRYERDGRPRAAVEYVEYTRWVYQMINS